MEFKLNDGEDFILLQSLLKACGLCDTGGTAKMAIVSGQVLLDGVVETQRGKKVRVGQVVTFNGETIKVI